MIASHSLLGDLLFILNRINKEIGKHEETPKFDARIDRNRRVIDISMGD